MGSHVWYWKYFIFVSSNFLLLIVFQIPHIYFTFDDLYWHIYLVNNVQDKEDHQLEELKDNRAIVDNNQAQSLTGKDIESMRRWESNIIVISGGFIKYVLH